MDAEKVLKAPVDAVATLGKLVATVTAPRKHTWPLLYPESLHADLRKFIWNLRDTLDHGDVTSLRQRGVTSLRQAVAPLGATPGATGADVTAVARAWREPVDALRKSWGQLSDQAMHIKITLGGKDMFEDMFEDTDEDTDDDTATTQARNLRDETAGQGTARDSPVAVAARPWVALSSAAATRTRKGAVVATGREKHRKKVQRLLRDLCIACDTAKEELCWKLEWQLDDIRPTLDDTEEDSADFCEYLVAEFEQLWEASARLTTRHLLVALGEIDFILSSPYGGSGGPGGPRGRAVAERCRKAMEDIPRLLEECDVTDVTSLGE